MTNEQIVAMAAWTLEDFQNDPLGAMAQIRELAAAHLALQQERDAAVRDLDRKCPLCKHYSEHLGIHTCRKCKFGLGDPDFEDRWEWRGPQPEQVLAPADQSAGAYADNPVLAQA